MQTLTALGLMSGTSLDGVDAVIVGVIDSLEMGGKVSYRKE